MSQLPPPPGPDLSTTPAGPGYPFAPPGQATPGTGTVPMALPYGPADAQPQRWTVDSNQAKLTIPYLGPEPTPSRLSGFAFLGACGASALLFVIRAGLYLHLGALEQNFLDHRSQALLADADSAAHLVSSMAPIILLSIGLAIILDLVWRLQRRPKHARTELGEAYVEFPMKWVTPVGIRVAWVGLAVAGMLASSAGSIHRTTLAADYPQHRQMLALGNLAWAGFWVALGVWVLIVNRSHARRMAFSGPYRADPSQVPFFPAVAGAVMLDTSESSSGLGWVVRTAGLAVAFIVGLVFVIGGVSDLTKGRLGSLGFVAVGAVLLGIVVFAMVRRARRGKL